MRELSKRNAGWPDRLCRSGAESTRCSTIRVPNLLNSKFILSLQSRRPANRNSNRPLLNRPSCRTPRPFFKDIFKIYLQRLAGANTAFSGHFMSRRLQRPLINGRSAPPNLPAPDYDVWYPVFPQPDIVTRD